MRCKRSDAARKGSRHFSQNMDGTAMGRPVEEGNMNPDYEAGITIGDNDPSCKSTFQDIPMAPSPPLEWADEPDFALPGEWLHMTSISPAMMSRHWMVLGETGSGKTKSVILPLLNSLLEYELETNPVANKEVTHG